MPVHLSHKHFGGEGKQPLVIIHGLMGSARNWTTTGADLKEMFEVWAVDLRNHGESPHADTMTYDVMVEDVRRWMDAQQIESAVLMGHSMGGKVAMAFATRYPERTEALVIVDVAPRNAPPRWEEEFTAMSAIDTKSLKSRAEAEKILEEHGVPGWAFRKFLVSNLVRDHEGGFHWQINLPVLHESLPQLFSNPLKPRDNYTGPTLVIRGERSNFVRGEDLPLFFRHFPKARMATVKGAGHNVHTDHRKAFEEEVRKFFTADLQQKA